MVYNLDSINNLKQLIDELEAKRKKLDVQIQCAKTLLSTLLEDDCDIESIDNLVTGYSKSKKLSESTKEKMRIAQQNRQNREKKFKLEQIQDFLKNKIAATTKEVAEYMQLTEYVVKKYMRSETSHCIEYQPDTWKFID